MTKSRIFKNLNLRRKADRNFRGNLLKNHFRHIKVYSNLPSWLARSCCHMSAFWKTKGWSSHFWEGPIFQVLRHGNSPPSKTLKTKKQVFLHHWRFWPAQKPKIWSFFCRKKFVSENYVVWKLRAFGLKVSTFPCLLVVAIRVADLVAFTIGVIQKIRLSCRGGRGGP